MLIGSLFSGVGGLELGLERALHARVAWQVEQSAFCRQILARHWPDAQRFDDICTVGACNLARIDVLCGGFPCTDLSAAGKRAGLGTEHAPTRSGLWYEMRRIIEELRPRFVVVENVAHTWRSYVPIVRRALWSIGYASVPIRVRASDVGARHERARVFIVAGTGHADIDRIGREARREHEPWGRIGAGGPCEAIGGEDGSAGHAPNPHDPRKSQPQGRLAELGGWAGDGVVAHIARVRFATGPAEHGPERAGRAESTGGVAADDAGLGLEEREHERRNGREECAPPPGGAGDDTGKISPGFGLPPRSWMVRAVHGLPGGVDGPWADVGWTPARLRGARIHALGNSCVPACAEAIGRLIVASVCPPVARAIAGALVG